MVWRGAAVYAQLRKRSECKYRKLLLVPGWVTTRILSNKPLPHSTRLMNFVVEALILVKINNLQWT